jgi:dTDP-4-dehydrorhamnose reductase
MCAVVAAFGLDATVTPVAQSEFGAAARRPLNSALDCRRAADLTRWSMPDWRDGLRRYVDARTDASAPAR